MKKIAVFLAALFIFSLSAAAQENQDFYVDFQTGSDLADGSITAPFKTVQAAADAAEKQNGDVCIHLSGGYHFLEKPLVLTYNHGKSGRTLTFQGENDAVLSGGKKVTGWTLFDSEKNIYSAPADNILTRQLFVNGTRAVRARSGYSPFENVKNNETGFTTTSDLLTNIKNIGDVELIYREFWANPRIAVKNVSKQDKTASVEMRPLWSKAVNNGQASVTAPWYAENAYEFIDEGGEFYLNTHENMFYYKPRDNENMETAEVIAPVLENLVTAKSSTADKPIRNITFKNLSFMHATWLKSTKDGGYVDNQDNYMAVGIENFIAPALLEVRYAKNINITGCTFAHSGALGLTMLDGLSSCALDGNEAYDLSCGAMCIGRPVSAAVQKVSDPESYDERDLVKNISVTNNYIHGTSCEYRGSAAISMGFPQNSNVSHNEICNVPYSGIHIGWGWATMAYSATKNFSVKNNYIHDIMFYDEGGLTDGGAIYILGGSGGSLDNLNTVEENYIRRQGNASAVLYCDNGSTFYKLSKNVIDERGVLWGNASPNWALGNTGTHDLFFVNNYVTTDSAPMRGSNTLSYDNYYQPDADWNAQALSIIKNSGPAAGYRCSKTSGAENILTSPKADLSVGETLNLAVKAYTAKASEEKIDSVTYMSENTRVADVSENGILTAKAPGKCKVNITVNTNGKILEKEKTVYVNDEFGGFIPGNGFSAAILRGSTRQLNVSGQSKFGRDCKLDNVKLESLTPETAEITENVITAKNTGDAKIKCSGDYNGKCFDGVFDMKVINFDSGENLPQFGTFSDKLSADLWNTSSDALVKPTANGVKISVPRGYAIYGGKKLQNEMLNFKMNLDAKWGWSSFVFRSADDKSGLTGSSTFYIICFTKNEIQLQRFNSGVRTVIFADVKGARSIGGTGYPVESDKPVFEMGKDYDVSIGACNEENGVRLLLKLDGKTIFNFLDDEETCIKESGYFGVLAVDVSLSIDMK